MNIISTIKPLILNLIKIKYFHVWQYHCERYFGMLQECTLISLEVALHHIMLPSLHLVWRAIKMTYTKSTFSQLESNDTHWQTDQLPTIFWSPVPLPWPRTAKKVGLSNTLSKESLEWVRTQHCPSEVPRNTLICDHDVHIGLVYLFRCLLVSVSCHCNGDISLPPNPQWAVTQLIEGGRLRSGPHKTPHLLHPHQTTHQIEYQTALLVVACRASERRMPVRHISDLFRLSKLYLWN